MPDDTFMKSLLHAGKMSDDRLKKAIEEIARTTRPLEQALLTIEKNSATAQLEETLGISRMLEENSSIKEMMKSLSEHDELTRTALGPVWELRQAGLLDPPWGRELELMTAFQDRFRLPEIGEVEHLLTQFREDSVFEKLARYSAEESSLRQAIESMRTPWLDGHEAMKSMAGFAEIQGIGHALRSVPAFDENFAAALRLDLGDWRDTITWPPQIFTDLAARADFYVRLGFNAGLTDFPLPAFEQSLEIAGLRSDPPTFAGGYGSPVRPAAGEEEEGLTRTNAAHDRLLRLERLLRSFIDEQMTHAFGKNWPKHRLPNGLYDQWREKKQKAEQAGAEVRPLVEYADFTDYAPVICRADNWRDVFGSFFNRQESVRESFQRLHPIRLDTMHARLITQDDELLLLVEVKRLVKVIVKRQS